MSKYDYIKEIIANNINADKLKDISNSVYKNIGDTIRNTDDRILTGAASGATGGLIGYEMGNNDIQDKLSQLPPEIQELIIAELEKINNK